MAERVPKLRDNTAVDGEQSDEILKYLKEILPNYDLVIVADYGHGMFNKDIINLITKESKFLAINTQTNAGNMGFNTISKYPSADYICIDEPEIRFDSRDKSGDVKELIYNVSSKLSCKNTIITRGIKGCMVHLRDNDSNGEIISIPAFSEKVIDTMGAGDAFLAITSPLVAKKTPMEVVGFIGNCVGSLAVTIIGNKEPIKKSTLAKYITSLMKV